MTKVDAQLASINFLILTTVSCKFHLEKIKNLSNLIRRAEIWIQI